MLEYTNNLERLVRDSERLQIIKDYLHNTESGVGNYIEKSVLLVLLGEKPTKATDK